MKITLISLDPHKELEDKNANEVLQWLAIRIKNGEYLLNVTVRELTTYINLSW